MRYRFLAIAGVLAVTGSWLMAQNIPIPLGRVPKDIKNREKVVVRGTIDRTIDLDHFVLDDGTGQLVVDMRSVRHRLKPGDEITVYGRFARNPAEFPRYNGEVAALEFALASDTQTAAALIRRYGRPASSSPASHEPVPAASSSGSIESRLKKLEGLKKQGLISDDEYRRHRERILGSL